MNFDFVTFKRGVRGQCKPRLIFSRTNGPNETSNKIPSNKLPRAQRALNKLLKHKLVIFLLTFTRTHCDKDSSKPVARHFNLPNHSKKHMAICGLSLHLGTTESRKNLEQKFIFQIGTLNPHGINERFSFN